MSNKIPVRVGGRFKIEAMKPDGTRRVVADWFDNIITNIGLDRLMTEPYATGYCHVGSGTATPVATNTALATPIAYTNNAIASAAGNAPSAPYYGWVRRTYRFAAGEAAGLISEVGIGWDTTGPCLLSRALTENSEGDPTTFTVLGDEVLDVTYELRLYPQTDDVSFDIVVSGQTHTCVMRPSLVTEQSWQPFYVFYPASHIPNVAAYSGPLGDVTERPSGLAATGAVDEQPYTTGAYIRGYSVSFDLDIANFPAPGIRSANIQTLHVGTFQCSFDPPIAKDANKLLTLNFALSVARFTP